MLEILKRLGQLSSSEWMPSPPATAEELEAIEQKYGIVLPADYRELMLATSGCGLYAYRTKLNLESADDVLWHNEDPRFKEHLPGMFVIGDDNGDAVFYYDPKNRLGRGAYALFEVDLGTIGFPHSKYAAANLIQLFDRIIAGESIWDYPYLGPLDHPDRAK